MTRERALKIVVVIVGVLFSAAVVPTLMYFGGQPVIWRPLLR